MKLTIEKGIDDPELNFLQKLMTVLISPKRLFQAVERENFIKTVQYNAILSFILAPLIAHILIQYQEGFQLHPKVNDYVLLGSIAWVSGIAGFLALAVAIYMRFSPKFVLLGLPGKGMKMKSYLDAYKLCVYSFTPGWIGACVLLTVLLFIPPYTMLNMPIPMLILLITLPYTFYIVYIGLHHFTGTGSVIDWIPRPFGMQSSTWLKISLVILLFVMIMFLWVLLKVYFLPIQ